MDGFAAITGGGPPAAVDIVPSYERWLETEAGVTLEPGQRELVRVGLDGRRPKPVDPDWRSPVLGDSARIFHFDLPPPEGALKTLAAILGIRSGKSRLLGALYAVYQADVVPLHPSQVAPGEVVYCSFIGPKQAKAVETMAYALGLIRENERLRARFVGRHIPEHNKCEAFTFRSKLGAPIEFVALAAGTGNIGARGRYHLDNVLEEYGLFKTGDYAVNDKDVYDGVKTRLWVGNGWRYGRQQVIGSPWAEEGHLFELYEQNKTSPISAVVAQASTDVIRTDPAQLAVMASMRREYETRGEYDVFLREYGARFLPLGSVQIYDKATLERCPSVARGELKPGDVVVVGIDLGLVHDFAAIVVVRVRTEPVPGAKTEPGEAPVTRRTYAVIDALEVPPEEGRPLQPSVVCGAFVEVMRHYGATHAMADQYYRESVREAIDGALDARGRKLRVLLSGSPTDEMETHVRARVLMGEGKVALLDDPVLRHQLGLVKRRPVGSKRWSLDIPRSKTGGHCDMAEAAARALYQAFGAVVTAPPPPKGTQARIDYEADRWEEKRAKQIAQRGR